MINHLPFFDDDNDFYTISLPLTVKEYRDLYNNRTNKELAKKELSYVAYICDYRSVGNVKGLSEKELHAQAVSDLDLGKDYKVDPFVVDAIERYKAENDKGVFGYFKELMITFENSRKAVTIVNSILSSQLEKVQNSDEKEKSNHIKTIISNIEDLKKIASSLERDVKNVNDNLIAVKHQEFKRIKARGDAYVSKSATVRR